MPSIDIRYFALFRERAGSDGERLQTVAATVSDLYRELEPRLGLELALVRAAVNGEFVENDYRLQDGDQVTFIPPVAGG